MKNMNVAITVELNSKTVINVTKKFASRIALKNEMKAMKAVIETNSMNVTEKVTYMYQNALGLMVIGGFDVINAKCVDRVETIC